MVLLTSSAFGNQFEVSSLIWQSPCQNSIVEKSTSLFFLKWNKTSDMLGYVGNIFLNAFHTLSIELSLITCCILIFTFPKQEKKNLSLMKKRKNNCEENNLLMKFGILMPNATAITTNIKFTEACPSKKSDSVFFPAT